MRKAARRLYGAYRQGFHKLIDNRLTDTLLRWADIPVIGPVLGLLLLPFLFLAAVEWLVAYLALCLAAMVFWTAPTIVWLSGFKSVSPVDAFSAALGAANGRDQYNLAFGINDDPGTIGFLLFNLAAWAAAIAVAAAIGYPFYRAWKRRQWKRFEQEWAQEHGSHVA